MSALAPADDAAIVQAVHDLGVAIALLRQDPPDPSVPRLHALLALDALVEARKRLAADMCREMLADGVTQFRDGPRTVSVCAGRVTVDVPDVGAVPESFLKLVPDKEVIRNYVLDHPDTNWASIKQGEPYITVRIKE